MPTFNPEMEKRGYDMGRRFSSVFTIKPDATNEALTDLSMQFAQWHSDTARDTISGMSFVKGCVEGLRGNTSSAQMTVEEKINWLVEREVNRSSKLLPKVSDGGEVT